MVAVWQEMGMEAIAQRWRQQAMGIGKPVVARLQDGQERHGIFVDLAPDGAMILRGEDGQIERILAGDVFFKPQA
jgi:BirA family biotin operon repressor/biotin-[acetyl-CoA-carboxylase] ligase